MSPEDFKEKVRQRPFEPFRICLTDGRAYEVRHPDLIMAGRRSAVIGMANPSDPDHLYDRYTIVDLLHIVRLEPSDSPTMPG
jgi:hypothetical protein